MHGTRHHARRPIHTIGFPLLGMVLLAGYTPHPPTPPTPPRVATVSMIPSPSEGLVCALQGHADQQTVAPTAGYGRLDRMRARYGQTACQSEGDHGRFAVRARDIQATLPGAEMPDQSAWLAER